jgi:hypothetical protein
MRRYFTPTLMAGTQSAPAVEAEVLPVRISRTGSSLLLPCHGRVPRAATVIGATTVMAGSCSAATAQANSSQRPAAVFDLHRAHRLQVRHRGDEDAPDGRLTRAVNGHEVGLLDQQDTTRAQSGHHPPKRQPLIRQPLHQPARVHHIEPARQFLGRDVMTQHLQPGAPRRFRLQEASLHGRHHRPAWRNSPGKPQRYRPAAPVP